MGCFCSSLTESEKEEIEKNKDLHKLNKLEKLSKYSLKDYVCFARFTNVYDGDTAQIVFMNPQNNIVKYSFRFYGYDSPEMKSHSANALKAKKILVDLLDERHYYFVVKFRKNCKYGRLMGDVYRIPKSQVRTKYYLKECLKFMKPEYSISDYMIKHGHSVPYYGGSKTKI